MSFCDLKAVSTPSALLPTKSYLLQQVPHPVGLWGPFLFKPPHPGIQFKLISISDALKSGETCWRTEVEAEGVQGIAVLLSCSLVDILPFSSTPVDLLHFRWDVPVPVTHCRPRSLLAFGVNYHLESSKQRVPVFCYRYELGKCV